MQSLPAKTIILANTIDISKSELPSMSNTFARYKDTLSHLDEAKKRERVLIRHIDHEKKQLKKEINHKRYSSYTQYMADIDRLTLNLHFVKQEQQTKKRLEQNMKKRNRRKQGIREVKQQDLAHKSSIYRYSQKMKAENQKFIDFFREKQLKQKEIVVIKERLKEKKRAYNMLEFYHTKIENLKKGKEQEVTAMVNQLAKNGQAIEKTVRANARLRLKREKSAEKVEKYRTTTKKREHSVISNPQ